MTTEIDPFIHLVVALPAEARPLISWFSLKREHPEQGFAVYSNQHIALILSGTGKLPAAAATAYLAARQKRSAHPIWINIGICGHSHLPVGSTILAHKIQDRERGRNWYPDICFHAPCPSSRLVCSDRIETEYADDDCAYDMESAGFMETAGRFASSELIHCLKVVSDNPQHPGPLADPQQAMQRVGGALDTLDRLIDALGRQSQSLHDAEPELQSLQDYRKHWSFSRSQQHQLELLLTRWQVLRPQDGLWSAELATCRNGREVIGFLQRYLDALPLQLGRHD